MLLPLVTHVADESGPAALGLNGQAFLIQLITFIIVFLVLRQFAFKPILKMLNERRDLIEEGVTLGEKMRAEEAKLETKVSDTLRQARASGDQIVADAEAAARQKIQQAETTAQERATGIIEDAKKRIEQDRKLEWSRLQGEVVQLVSEVSEAVIGEKVDAKKDAALIDTALKEHAAV